MKLWQDIRGAVIPMVAITIPVLIGVAGLGTEAGLWYVIKRHNQTAADLAAISGALELEAAYGYGLTNTSTGVYSDICSLAQQDAKNNGFASTVACPSTCANPAPGQVCVNNPPLLGTQVGNNGAVEVILNQKQNTLFASLFLPSVNITNRAVAAVEPPTAPACMLVAPDSPYLLNGSPSKYKSCPGGFGICLQGNATINAPGCSVVSDAQTDNAIDFTGTGSTYKITASSVITAGNITANGGAATSPPAQAFQQAVPDPYCASAPALTNCILSHSALTSGMPSTACPNPTPTTVSGVTWYTYAGNCTVAGSSLSKSNIILSGNTVITGGLTVAGTVNISPGTYWITDGDLNIKGTTLECTSCTLGGAGVTVIFTTLASKGTVGGINLGPGGGTMILNAPKTGTFAGMVLIQDAWGLPSTVTVDNSTAQGTPNETLSGLVYFPGSTMDFAGTPASTGPQCLLLVVGALAETGTPSLNTTGCSSVGLTLLPGTKVALAE